VHTSIEFAQWKRIHGPLVFFTDLRYYACIFNAWIMICGTFGTLT
jgi:hypothetical protein